MVLLSFFKTTKSKIPHKMKNTLEKTFQISQRFLSNFYSEIDKNPLLKKDLLNLKQTIFDKTPIKPIYKSLQFSDFLITNNLKDYCSAPKTDNFLEKSFKVPKYFNALKNQVLGPFEQYLSQFKVFKEYKALKRIENELIPEIIKKSFKFGENNKNVTKETEESLKQLKKHIFESEKDWINKEITVVDIRQVETESIKIVNIKKTVKCTFEISVVLSGDLNGVKRHVKQSFNCSLDFIYENKEFIASNFSYSPFD